MFADPFQATAPTEIYNAPQRLTGASVRRPVGRTAQTPTLSTAASEYDTQASEYEFQDAQAEESRQFIEHDTKVHPAVREAILVAFPQLSEATAVSRLSMRLVNHVLSMARVDEETGGKIVPHGLLARFDAHTGDDCNYASGKALDRFSELLGGAACPVPLGITVTDYSVKDGRCRTLIIDWPKSVEDAFIRLEREQMSDHEADRNRAKEQVYFVSGNKVTKNTRTREKKSIVARRNRVESLLPEDCMTRGLIQLLHSHLTEHHQAINKATNAGLLNLTRWFNEVYLPSEIPKSRRGKQRDPKGSLRYRGWLQTLTDVMPNMSADFHYRVTPRSDRAQHVGALSPQFPRAGIKALYSHLTRLDLKNSQPSIAAARWGVDSLRTILETRESLWDYFFEELTLDALCISTGASKAEVKAALKTAVCCLLFGMSETRIQSELTWNFHDALYPSMKGREKARNLAKRFLALPVMCDVLAARDRELATIRRECGAWMPDWIQGGIRHKGKWIPLSDPEGRLPGAYEHDVRSLLARQTQAIELSLMLAGAERIKSLGADVVIVLWQHDGLTLTFRDESVREKHTNSIINAVNERCLSSGIPTQLRRDN